MSAKTCSMTALVQARRDGRLDDRERASIDRHIAGCADCRAFDADLVRLAALARAPLPAASPLVHRRGRLRLLQAAAVLDSAADRGSMDGTVSAAVAPPRPSWRAPAIAALAAVLMAATGASRSRIDAATSGGPPVPTTEPQLAEAPVAPITTPAPTAIPAPTAPTATEEHDAAPVKHASVQHPRHAPKPAETAAPRAADGGDLTAGVGSLARGDFGDAAERLRAFRKAHPEDARAEDAAFLTVLALDRAGRRDEAAAAAREYLAAYPNGYRRAEAAAIAAR